MSVDNYYLLFIGGSRHNETHIRHSIPAVLNVLPDLAVNKSPSVIGVPEPLQITPEIYRRHLVKIQETEESDVTIYICYVHESIPEDSFLRMVKPGIIPETSKTFLANATHKFGFRSIDA